MEMTFFGQKKPGWKNCGKRFIRGINAMERYLRRLTAAVFIGIGIYFTITYLLKIRF